MTRPRFLADQDFNERIVSGVLRREPTIEFIRIRDVGLAESSDDEILQYAGQEDYIVTTHDVNTFAAAAIARIAANQTMSGLLLVPQTKPIGRVIESLVLIWVASEASEWHSRIEFLPFK